MIKTYKLNVWTVLFVSKQHGRRDSSMLLTELDWLVVLAVAAALLAMAYRTRRYAKSTADFLAANRIAGRYLLMTAEGMVGLSAIGYLAMWQMQYRAGMMSSWWGQLNSPVTLILLLVGWVIYRYRESRVLTLAQLFEIRYSRNFRITAALVCWISGVLNYGIFPAAGANFFVHYCGLPDYYKVLGLTLPTYDTLVIVLVLVALYFTFVGGQISVLVTDFVQGFLSNFFLVVLLVFLIVKFPLSDVFEGLLYAKPGESKVNPFDTNQIKGFDPWYFLIGIFGSVINRMAWQGQQAYNASARSPHEAKMAGVLSGLRGWGFSYGMLLLPLIAYMLMHHPEYSDSAAQITEQLARIENEQIRDQMITPVSMTTYLPVGMMGVFAAVMFAAFVSTNDTYLHSWGSIFIQDVLLPWRNKPLSNRAHLLLLRLSIIAVGLFGMGFSLLVRQTQDILMFFAITGAIWLGGAGVVIIGALYTRWGTTAGAYAVLLGGSAFAVAGTVLKQMQVPWLEHKYTTSQWLYFYAMVLSAVLYVGVPLLGRRHRFNLDKMLHRGRYAVAGDRIAGYADAVRPRWTWKAALGYTDEFTTGDKWIYGLTIGKTLLQLAAFLVILLLAVTVGLSDRAWADYHRYMLWFFIATSFAIALWLTIGGLRDAIQMFRDLPRLQRDYEDDGTVRDHDYEQQN